MMGGSRSLVIFGAFLLFGCVYIFIETPTEDLSLPEPEYSPDARRRLFWRQNVPIPLHTPGQVPGSSSPTASPSPTSIESKSTSISSSETPSSSPLQDTKVILQGSTNLPHVISVGDSIIGRGDNIDKKFPCYSIASALYYDLPRVHIIPNGGDAYRNKVTSTIKYLELANLPDNLLVMFIDTFDVMFIRRPEPNEVVTKFFEMTNGDTNAVIISGECNCFPASSQASCDRVDTMYKMPFRYINSGQWLATAGTLLKFLRGLEECYHSQGGWNTDQDVFHHFCFTDHQYNAEKIGLRCVVDANTEILRSAWELGAECPAFKNGGQQLVSINGNHVTPCRFNPSHQCPTDPTTQGQPLTMHYNGKSPNTWAGLLDNYQTFIAFDPDFDKSDNLRFGCEKVVRFEQVDGKETIVESCEPFTASCGKLLGLM